MILKNKKKRKHRVKAAPGSETLSAELKQWIYDTGGTNKAASIDTLLENREPVEVISCLAKIPDLDRYYLAKRLREVRSLTYDRHPVRTIGSYYRSIANGGIQHVLCALAYLWVQMGYKVVIITDEQEEENECKLPEGVDRAFISACSPDCYERRAQEWSALISEYKIDVVVLHSYMDNLLLWDELLIKASGSACVIHSHNVFALEMQQIFREYSKFVAPYLLADGVITLSDVDQRFWNCFNGNVQKVINPYPLTENRANWAVSRCEGHDILWVGRLSREKRPFDALEIMREVLTEVPDAKLHIVGSGKDERYDESFRKAVARDPIAESIILYGFQKNVRPFYEKASVFLSTSEYEGYPLTLQECLLSGLPVVAYELPYLTLMQDNPAVYSVRQGDIKGAAREIIRLLKDDGMRKESGKKAKAYIGRFEQYDFEGRWREIFCSISKERNGVPPVEMNMMETLIMHHDRGISEWLSFRTVYNRPTVRAAIYITKIYDYVKRLGRKMWNKNCIKKMCSIRTRK